MKKELSRRDLIGRAGLALGGLVTLGVACGEESASCPPQVCPDPVDPGPQAAQFPYQQHLPAGYQLDVAAVKEAAYHGYYAGGCGHGSFNGLVKHLADTAGQPFSLLPLDLGMFGGGGIAGYGSVCGAALGSMLALNFTRPERRQRDAREGERAQPHDGRAHAVVRGVRLPGLRAGGGGRG